MKLKITSNVCKVMEVHDSLYLDLRNDLQSDANTHDPFEEPGKGAKVKVEVQLLDDQDNVLATAVSEWETQ